MGISLHKETKMLYLVIKYIDASSVESARRKEKSTPIHEICLSSKWSEAFLIESFSRKSDRKIGYETKKEAKTS